MGSKQSGCCYLFCPREFYQITFAFSAFVHLCTCISNKVWSLNSAHTLDNAMQLYSNGPFPFVGEIRLMCIMLFHIAGATTVHVL